MKSKEQDKGPWKWDASHKKTRQEKEGWVPLYINWLSNKKLGELISTFIHFLCEERREVIERMGQKKFVES